MFYYIYLLTLNNGDIYTGYTTDLRTRLTEHNRGKVESTKHKKPVQLIHYEAYLNKEDAQRREKYLKSSDGKRDLKRQLSVLFTSLGKKI